MRRGPYGSKPQQKERLQSSPPLAMASDRSQWMNAEEAATYLRKFKKKDGKPSVGAIHTMVYRGQLTCQKFFGRLLFLRSELDRLIALSPQLGG